MGEPTIDLKCNFHALTRPDGSVLYCEGDTSVVAGVYGPVEAKNRNMLIDKACIECNYRPKVGLPSVKDRLYESLITNICEAALRNSMHPRTAILINVQEMQNTGYLISCSINAVCLASLAAKFDMKFMFAAVTCFLTTEHQFSLIAPIGKQSVKASFVLVFDSVEKKIVASHTQGSYTQDEYEQALSLCRHQSTNIFAFYKEHLVKVIE